MSQQFRTAVRTIVDAALEGTGYSTSSLVKSAIEQVENGVTEQVAKSADVLRGVAAEYGLSESEIENVLIQAGLADEPEPEVEEVTEVTVEGLAAEVATIKATLEEIVKIARRYGYTGA